jgi:hypothetical protein
VDGEAARDLAFQLRDEWAGEEGPFVCTIDARRFICFTVDAQAAFEELLDEALSRGLIRITVLAVSTALAGLFCDIMVRSDAMSIYQFLDVSYEKEYEAEMEEWLSEPFTAEPHA